MSNESFDIEQALPMLMTTEVSRSPRFLAPFSRSFKNLVVTKKIAAKLVSRTWCHVSKLCIWNNDSPRVAFSGEDLLTMKGEIGPGIPALIWVKKLRAELRGALRTC